MQKSGHVLVVSRPSDGAFWTLRKLLALFKDTNAENAHQTTGPWTIISSLNSSPPTTLRVGLRYLTGDLTGQMHKIPRVYRGPYGFTGKMTPGGVSLPLPLKIPIVILVRVLNLPPKPVPIIPEDRFTPAHFKANQAYSRLF